jgi:hypothetical protein
VLVAGSHGRLTATRSVSSRAGGGSAWIDPRHNYEQTLQLTLDARQADAIQPKPRPAVTNPRISV